MPRWDLLMLNVEERTQDRCSPRQVFVRLALVAAGLFLAGLWVGHYLLGQ